MEFICKKPSEIFPNELEEIIKIISEYRDMSKDEIRSRILNSECIFIAKDNDKIVGTVSVKVPNDIISDNAFIKSGSEYKYGEFQFELGYLYVLEEYRNRGIAYNLEKMLCSTYKDYNIFAITNENNNISISLKLKLGFIQTGNKFKDRKSDNYLKLFIKKSEK